MTVLILFESIEGQTAKIAGFVEDLVRASGHDVQVVDVGSAAEVSLDAASHVILAASVHQRRHPRMFEATVTAQSDALDRLPTLMLSVSLNAAFEEGREEAQDYLDEMKMRTGFHPKQEALIAGAVKTGKYDYFAMQVVRFVLLRGRDVDQNATEHEFTDWDALRETVTGFLNNA